MGAMSELVQAILRRGEADLAKDGVAQTLQGLSLIQ